MQSEFDESMIKLTELKNKHKEEFKLIRGGESISMKGSGRTISFITPTIFKVEADFPHFNYQN